MLWFYNKLSEDDNTVTYAYGWNTRETTGQLMFNKITQDVSVLKIADNDTDYGAKCVFR
jgi:hypothetical protein